MTTGALPAVIIEETGPRDGLQNEKKVFSVEMRIDLINALQSCGLRRIQIGSFVRNDRVPQMANTEEVFRKIRKRPEVVYTALVLNEKGLHRAFEVGMSHVGVFISASDTHSRRNLGVSLDDAKGKIARLILLATREGIKVQGGIMNAFGCREEGLIPKGRVQDLVKLLLDAGVHEISLADTSGMANPRSVEEMIEGLRAEGCDRGGGALCREPILGLHLHDTLGMGLVNAYAGWRCGVRRFDGAFGGLGGCPFVPGAPGNVPTEDLAFLFETMGVSTGILTEELCHVVARWERLLGRSLPGRYCRNTAPRQSRKDDQDWSVCLRARIHR